MGLSIKCPKCGHINTEKQLVFVDKENELGEDFCTITLDCAGCKECLYEGSAWGHSDYNDKEDIYEDIKDELNKK